MKILSGTQFQWIAYNIATKEFLEPGEEVTRPSTVITQKRYCIFLKIIVVLVLDFNLILNYKMANGIIVVRVAEGNLFMKYGLKELI